MTTQYSTVTYSTTSVTTTTTSLFPPTNSTYKLTWIDGNATNTQPSCGSYVLSVDTTYEMHSKVSSNIIQWARFPSGQLVQPVTQTVFTDQAYLSIDSTYDYSSGYCSVGIPTNVTTFVTDSTNFILSPTTTMIVLQR